VPSYRDTVPYISRYLIVIWLVTLMAQYKVSFLKTKYWCYRCDTKYCNNKFSHWSVILDKGCIYCVLWKAFIDQFYG